MNGLGRIFDLSNAIQVVDLAGGAQTGKRVHLRNYETVAIVVFKEAGAAAEASTFTVQEHNASTGGTSANLAVITEFYHKTEATLDGDEIWTRVTQAAAATFSVAASDQESIIVAEIEAASLSAGFEWISVNSSDVTTAGQFGGALYLLHGLKIQRRPDLLAEPLT